MVIYSVTTLIPIGLTVGAYFLSALFLSPINAIALAFLFGGIISSLMELVGIKNHIFFIPYAVWAGFLAIEQAFQPLRSNGIGFFSVIKAEPTVFAYIASVITVIIALIALIFRLTAGKQIAQEEGMAGTDQSAPK